MNPSPRDVSQKIISNIEQVIRGQRDSLRKILAALATGGPSTWTTLSGTSPVTVPNDSQMKFFRLIAAP